MPNPFLSIADVPTPPPTFVEKAKGLFGKLKADARDAIGAALLAKEIAKVVEVLETDKPQKEKLRAVFDVAYKAIRGPGASESGYDPEVTLEQVANTTEADAKKAIDGIKKEVLLGLFMVFIDP